MADELDDLDRKILAVLAADARTPVVQIAEKVGLSRPAVRDRMEKLEKSGVIEGTTVVVNPEAMGRGVTAFISAIFNGSMNRKATEAFHALMEREEVVEIHAVAGQDCYLLKVRTDSISSLNSLVNVLSADPLAMTTRTTIVLETFCEKVGGLVRPVRRGKSPMSSHDRFYGWLAFGLVSFVWGTTYLAIRVAIETLPTFLFPAFRFILGGLILLAICLARGQKLPTRAADWINLAVIGVLMVAVGNVAVVYSEHSVTSGFAALLVATAPFSMSLIELLRREGERVTRRRALGMLVGFGGVGILVAPELQGAGSHGFLIGVLIIIGSTFAWNLGSIRSKYHLSKELSPLIAASLQMIFGGLAAGAVGLAMGESPHFEFTARTLVAFLYLTLFGSVIAYTSYVYALSKLPTTTVSLHTYINPVVAVFLGWLILNEPLGWNALSAMLVIFAGVAIVQTGRPRMVPQTATGILKELEAEN